MHLTKRSAIAPSLTLAMNAKAKRMRSSGVDVISFAAGEPDFHTPEFIKEAGEKAIQDNKTYYTPASGIHELKEAVVRKLRVENDLTYETNEIIISSGAKHSVFNVLAVLAEDGDEVLIPAPYWVSYSEMVGICGAVPVFIDAAEEKDFKITPSQLEKALTGRTRVLLLNSPCNPTGAVYSREELYALAELLQESDVITISDEIYEKIVYDQNEHVSIATFSEKMKKKTVVINGMSKAFSMTGWRIGYAAGLKPIIEAVNKIQGHTTGNPTSISQWASVEGLSHEQPFITKWVAEFAKRRDFIVTELNSIKGVTCTNPGGAFYVFPNISALFGHTFSGIEVRGSMELADALLEKAHVAVVPGKAFGADDYIRISFATSMENIEEGIQRMKKFISG